MTRAAEGSAGKQADHKGCGTTPARNSRDSVVRVLWDPVARPDLSRAFFHFVDECAGLNPEVSDKEQQENRGSQRSSHVPLFLTPYPSARQQGGFAIPSEFVIGTSDMEMILGRIRQLEILYGAPETPRQSINSIPISGIPLSLLRSMCVGKFRRDFCMDDENHGQGDMDPSKLRYMDLSKAREEWVTRNRKRFWPEEVTEKMTQIKDNNKAAWSTYRILFMNEIEYINAAMEAVESAATAAKKEANKPADG